ncbi:transcriptional activator of glycolytic enzymes-domain-containing protein [Lipomyces tetrasporus]
MSDNAATTIEQSRAPTMQTPISALPIPKYKLPRYVSTVAELYRVWYTGSVSFPSIVSLDERYSAAWRSGDRQYYSVRLQIIREVDRLAATRNISERDAVLLLDTERRQKNWTLNMLSNELRKRNQL